MAQEVIYNTSGRRVAVLFRCDCGQLVKISIARLKRNKHRDACSKCWVPPKRSRPNTLRQRHLSEYQTWLIIRRRAKGAWRTDFSKFLSDMGPRPRKGWQILRYDPKQAFSSANCYWGPRPLPRDQNKPRTNHRTERRKQRQEQHNADE